MDKTFSLGFAVGATLTSSFNSSIKLAKMNINDIGKAFKSINSTKLNIKNFKKLSKNAKDNKNALNKLGSSLKKDGIDVRNFGESVRHLNVKMLNLKKLAKVKVDISHKKAAFNDVKSSLLGIGATAFGLTKFLNARSDILQAQGEIESLGISSLGVKAITKSAMAFSNKYAGVVAPDFIKASYDIKSGISSLSDEGVAKFTTLASKTAIATKSTSAQMTKLFALGHGIFRKDFSSDFDFGEKFSSAIAGAVKAFRTDGEDLSRGISNIGAAASSMGVTLQEELSIIGIAKSSFDNASEAATGYRAFLDNVGKAQKDLGLEFTNSSGKLLPMTKILGLIKEKYNNLEDVSQSDALKKAFGSAEAVKLIKGLINKTDDLTISQTNLSKSMQNGTKDMEDMAQAMQKGKGFALLGQQLGNLGAEIGKSFYPLAKLLSDYIGGIVTGLQKLNEKIPFLLPLISGLTAGIALFVAISKLAKIVTLGVKIAMDGLKASYIGHLIAHPKLALALRNFNILSSRAKMNTLAKAGAMKIATVTSIAFSSAIKGLGVAFRFVGNSLAWVGKALFFNPLGLALIATAITIYKFWEPIKAFFSGFFSGLKTGLDPIISVFDKFFTSIGNITGQLFSMLGMSNSTKESLASVGRVGALIGKGLGFVFNALLTPIEILINALSKIIEFGSSFIGSIASFFGFGDEKIGRGINKKIAITPQLESFNPNMGNASLNYTTPKIPNSSRKDINQTNHISVVVHNPTSNVDVQKAIKDEMANPSSISLSDAY